MKNIFKIICFSVLLLSANIVDAVAADVATLCAKTDKQLTCADLNYTLNTEQKNSYYKNYSGAVCSECPLSRLYFSCARRSTSAVTERLDTVEALDVTIPTCGAYPSCSDMGYRISSTDVIKIRSTRSCSACPFDGTKWACVGPSGLLKVN